MLIGSRKPWPSGSTRHLGGGLTSVPCHPSEVKPATHSLARHSVMQGGHETLGHPPVHICVHLPFHQSFMLFFITENSFCACLNLKNMKVIFYPQKVETNTSQNYGKQRGLHGSPCLCVLCLAFSDTARVSYPFPI